jgi:hypothetical protein
VSVLTTSRRPAAVEGPRPKVEAEGWRPHQTDQRDSPQTLVDDLYIHTWRARPAWRRSRP